MAAHPIAQYSEIPLNEYELKSVRALVAYAAHTKSIHEDTVSEIMRTRFSVPEITNLRQKDYDDAVCFLIDFSETFN